MSRYDSDVSEPFQDSGSEYHPSSTDDNSSTTALGVLTEEINNENIENKGRKKKRRFTSWQRNVRKTKRAKGEAYVYSQGQKVQARQQGIECGCKKVCFSKFSAEERKTIFNSFNALAEQEKQDSYLAGLISATLKKTVLSRKENPEKCENTFKYMVS